MLDVPRDAGKLNPLQTRLGTNGERDNRRLHRRLTTPRSTKSRLHQITVKPLRLEWERYPESPESPGSLISPKHS